MGSDTFFPFVIFGNQRDSSVEALTQTLSSLDIGHPAACPSPATSASVGGARPKVQRSPETLLREHDVREESPEQSQSAERSRPVTQVRRELEVLRQLDRLGTDFIPTRLESSSFISDVCSSSPLQAGGAQVAAGGAQAAAGGAQAAPEAEGACGWSASHVSLELTCGGQSDVSGQMSEM